MTASTATAQAPARGSPGRLLVATVAATTVALGLATGTGPLVGPVAATYGVGSAPASLMFAATLSTMLGLGVVTGPLSQRHGARPLAMLAAVLVPAGLLVLAVADTFPVAFAGFALGVGGGAGCLFVPLQTAVGTAFDRHRGPALVIATAGAGLATVVTPPTTVFLVAEFGLRSAAVLLALVTVVVLGACVPAVPGGRAPGSTPLPGLRAIRAVLCDRGFRSYALGVVGLAAAMFVPYVHLASFAAMRGIGLATGAALVALAGTASLLARLLAVPAVARWGAWTVCRVGAVAMTVGLGLWLLADGHGAGLVAFAGVFGCAHGTFVGLTGAAAAQLFGVAGFGLRLGVLHLAAAAGGLLGPAVAGILADAADSSVAGVLVAVGFGAAGCVAFLRCRVVPASSSATVAHSGSTGRHHMTEGARAVPMPPWRWST